MPFSQQYAMTLKARGEPGYFELGPQPVFGDSMTATTGKGKEYSFRERMNTFRGEGKGHLAHMSRYYEPDRATQAADAAPQQARSTALKSGKELSGVWSSIMQPAATDTRDYGELVLGRFTSSMDKAMGGDDRTTSQWVNRGIRRSGKFWGNDFDIKLEQSSPVFRGFLETVVGKEEMQNVRSLEMTRAAGNSTTSKLLSMSQKELGTNDAKKGKASFKKHVDKKLAMMNTQIKNAVVAMSQDEKSLKKYQAYRVGSVGGSSSLAARGLIGADNILQTTIRDFLGKTTRSNMIAQIEGTTEPAKHLYQVRLGKNMLGFALISAKSVPLNAKISYPKLQVAPKVIVMQVATGPNQLINAYGDYLKELDGVDSELVTSTMAKSETYGSNVAVLTEDRVAHVGHSADIDAAQMVQDSTGLDVGNKVLSNVKLVPMDIAENIRKQMIAHFTKGGVSKRFSRWYQSLMRDSNRLTKAWFNNVPKSTRTKGGKKFSEEWVFGDDKGNPNKRFLGVWSEQSQDTWKNDVGRNVSIAPFVISRRKGVAAFRTGGDYGNS